MILKEVITNGNTTDEAIEAGCQQLEVSRDEVKFEILELPKQKTLGLFGGSPAIVRVYIESDPAQDAKEYLDTIIKAMGLEGIEIEIKYNEDGSGAELDLTGEGLGNVIGKHGETLSALQYLVSLSANKKGDEYFRITINIGNYRERHENSLENFAKKTAYRALKLNTNLALESMNPYERRIIHTAVQEVEGVSSWSVGEGSNRHVVIGPEGLNEGEDGLPVSKSHSYGKKNYGRGGYDRRGGGRGGYRNGRRYQNNRGGYHGYNNGFYNGDRQDQDEQGGYMRQGRYGGYGYSNGSNYDSDGENGGYNEGYCRKNNNYNGRGGNNRRGGYNGGYNNNNYNRNNNRGGSTEVREVRKDSSAPLYGRIEVPKKTTDDEE